MSKYGKYTGGQIEAVLNMIGGESVMDGLLGGTMQVTAMAVIKPITKKTLVVCSAYNGCKCIVCHGYFADGDDMCVNGHTIGQRYEVA